MAELIPRHVQKLFARVYHESRTITPTQLVVAVESHAEHGEGANVELSAASAAVAKAVAMDNRGKTLLERVEPVLSDLETFFANNPNFETVYRGSDEKYHPGPAEIITKALVEGLALERFRQDVNVKLQHAGNWKVDPDLVMDTVVAEAKEWRKIEDFSQSSTSTPHSRQQDSKFHQHGSKSAGSSVKWECHRCGQRGHIAGNCMTPSPVASGGEQGHSSAARQQRPPHKGNNRGHRGAGGGDLPRVEDLRGPLLLSSSTRLRRTIPGPPDRGRVERLHNGLCRWTRVPPLLRRRWRRRRCRQQQRRARCLPLHRG